MLEVFATFAVAVATGISVLAFSKPAGWEAIYIKLVSSVGFCGALCFALWGVTFALPDGAIVIQIRTAAALFGLGCTFVCTWTGYMHWLTKPL